MWATVVFMQADAPDDATVRAALGVSNRQTDDGAAARVILGRADDYADSLAGSALAGTDSSALQDP